MTLVADHPHLGAGSKVTRLENMTDFFWVWAEEKYRGRGRTVAHLNATEFEPWIRQSANQGMTPPVGPLQLYRGDTAGG